MLCLKLAMLRRKLILFASNRGNKEIILQAISHQNLYFLYKYKKLLKKLFLQVQVTTS